MVSTRKKRQSNKRLLSQLDDFDQDMIIGNADSERQENAVVNMGTNDRDFTVSNSSNNTAVNENAMNVKTLERRFNERIDREMSTIVDTVEDRIQNAILTAIENIVARKIELAIRSINASSGRDVTSVIANSERGEHVGINASFENASENNNTLRVPNVSDETRLNIPDEVGEWSVPETRFDRQPHTPHMVTGVKERHNILPEGSEHIHNSHHMMTGQTAHINQIPEFLTGRTQTSRNPSSHQYQNLSTQVSQDNNLPVVEHTPTHQNLDANNSINRLADAIAGITTQQPSRILIEQDSDPTLLNFKREMLGLPFDEQILLNDARYMHYSRNKKRIIIKDDILYRQYYNDIGEVSHLQVLLPGQLLKVLLQSLHGTAGKHPGISKMMQEIRQKYYFPSIAPYVRNWVRDCEICIHDKRINNTRITPELIHIPEWDLGPEDLMQIDILPELPPSGGYENIITAIDVFSRYAFAYPVSNPTAVNTAKVIIDIMTRHAYLPTLIITDKGGVFVSQVIHEVAEILGINLKHATTKHAQTIGVLERAHATIKTSLKMASGEYRKHWHKYLPIAILNYNTTYHSSIDCEPSRVFHGRVPHNILDHKLGLRFNPNITPTTDFAEELLRRTKILYDKTKKNVMQSYIKYKRYYDKKAKASPLKEKDYCFILQPKADHQGSKIPFRDFRWIGPYIVEKVLPNNNYIVRKLNTNKTQILHRIRLRKYNPEKPPEDNYSEVQWQTDDNIVVPQDDLYTIAWEAEFGGHLFDLPIIYTDPNAIDFDENHTQGTDTVIVPRSYFHDSNDGQNREIRPNSEILTNQYREL